MRRQEDRRRINRPLERQPEHGPGPPEHGPGPPNRGLERRQRKESELRIAAVNVRHTGSTADFLAIMSRRNIDILCMTETGIRTPQFEDPESGTQFFFATAHPYGVGVAVKRGLKVTDVSAYGRVLRIEVRMTRRVSIVACYAPTMSATLEEKQQFYDTLTTALSEGARDKLLVGDFNARIRSATCQKTNENGKRLSEIVQQHDLFNIADRFHKARRKCWTWRSPLDRRRYTLDYAFGTARLRKAAQDLRISWSELETDHKMITIRLYFKQRAARNLRQQAEKGMNPVFTPHRRRGPVEEEWKKFNECITQGTPKGKLPKKPWITEEVKQRIEEKQAAFVAAREAPSGQAWKTYKDARRKAKKAERTAWKQWWETWATEVEEAFGDGRISAGYSILRQRYKPKMKRVPTSREKVEKCRSYLEGLLCHPREIEGERAKLLPAMRPTSPIDDHPPTEKEVRDSVRRLKNTAPWPGDGLRACVLQNSEALILALCQLLVVTWTYMVAPEAWSAAVLCPIPKKSDATRWEDHRFISLLSVAGKALCRILVERLTKIPIDPCQYGFRRYRDRIGAIAALKQIQHLAKRRGLPLTMVFIDSEKAYDSIHRHVIMETLEQAGVGERVRNIVASLYDDEVSVRLGTVRSKPLNTTMGVRQGCVLSPLLFNLVLDRAIRTASPKMQGVTLLKASGETMKVCILAYADDLVVLSESTAQAQEDVSALVACLTTLGLKCNIKKTEVVCCEDKRSRPVEALDLDELPVAIVQYPGPALFYKMQGSQSEQCPICHNVFRGDVCIRKHFRTMHGLTVNVGKTYPQKVEKTPVEDKKCPACGKIFAAHKSAVLHWKRRVCHSVPYGTVGFEYISGCREQLLPHTPNEPVPGVTMEKEDAKPILVYGRPLKFVRHFKYLGRAISHDESDTKAVTESIQKCWKTFNALHKNFFSSKRTSTSTRLKVAKAVMMSQLTSGGATWTLTKHEMNRIQCTQQRILRFALHHHPRIDSSGMLVFPKREEILRQAAMPDIADQIAAVRLKWYAHVCRHDEFTSAILHASMQQPTISSITNARCITSHIQQDMLKCELRQADVHDRSRWRARVKATFLVGKQREAAQAV